MMNYVIKMNEGKIEFYGTAKETEKQKFFEEFIKSNKKENINKNINNNMKNKKNKKEKKEKNELESDYNESDKFLISIKGNKKKLPIILKKKEYKIS